MEQEDSLKHGKLTNGEQADSLKQNNLAGEQTD